MECNLVTDFAHEKSPKFGLFLCRAETGIYQPLPLKVLKILTGASLLVGGSEGIR
jgi:hypothetical protein